MAVIICITYGVEWYRVSNYYMYIGLRLLFPIDQQFHLYSSKASQTYMVTINIYN